VRNRARELEAQAPPDAVVVHVIPLLVETGQAGDFDVVLVVDVAPEVQRDRLVRRDGLSVAEADARIAAQASRADRLAAADHVLDNSRGLLDLEKQVARLWPELLIGDAAT
jgi:dephospho-CoA kinase